MLVSQGKPPSLPYRCSHQLSLPGRRVLENHEEEKQKGEKERHRIRLPLLELHKGNRNPGNRSKHHVRRKLNDHQHGYLGRETAVGVRHAGFKERKKARKSHSSQTSGTGGLGRTARAFLWLARPVVLSDTVGAGSSRVGLFCNFSRL